MTKRAYYDTELSADGKFAANITQVTECRGKTALVLDRTMFYPEGGGQPSDRGAASIAGKSFAVAEVVEEDGEILHLVENAKGLAPGPADFYVDLRRRRDFTVQHTAQHLLSGTILRLTGFPTVSMHLGEEANTIDVDGKDFTKEMLLKIEDEVNDVIESAAPVLIHKCPPEKVEDFPLRKTPPQGEEVIRVVEIAGADFSPCCGTHAKNAGNIGILRIIGAEKYKGKTRITFIAGRRVLAANRMLRQNADVISRALSVPVEETGQAVMALLLKTAKLEAKLKVRDEEAARIKAVSIIEKAGLEGATPETWYADYFPDADMEEVTLVGRQLQEMSGAVFVLGAGADGRFAAICAAPGADIRPRLRKALEESGGQGGGGPGFFQGQFTFTEELKSFIDGFRT